MVIDWPTPGLAKIKLFKCDSEGANPHDSLLRMRSSSLQLELASKNLGRYLVECQRVWGYIAKQIVPWTDAIRTGKKPAFLASGFLRAMNRPQVKLRKLIIESSLLDEALYSDEHNLERGGQMGREALRDEYRRQMTAAIKGRLNTGNN